jgi:hypothetical protein
VATLAKFVKINYAAAKKMNDSELTATPGIFHIVNNRFSSSVTSISNTPEKHL